MSAKPTIVVVPGAWHGPETFSRVTSLLETAGYKVIGVKLPSVGGPVIDDFYPDVEVIQKELQARVDAEENVLLVMHSYGGCAGGEAAKGFLAPDIRKQGKKGGITGLVYLTAFMLPEGVALLDATRGSPGWFVMSEDGRIVNVDDPVKVFYHDCDKELAEATKKNLEQHSFKTLLSKMTYVPWNNEGVSTMYVRCTEDQAIPIQGQDAMIEGARAAGAKIDVETLKAAHSPFLNMPAETAQAIRKAAGETV